MTPSAPLPRWVRRRDGQLVPFEPDRISTALFAATEDLLKPDAFLANELTEGVLHFLAQESEIPTTAQIADLVEKVVRELGHPAVAQAFANRRVEEAAEAKEVLLASDVIPFAEALQSFREAAGLNAVYSRDLIAAHTQGLIGLEGLECPEHVPRAVVQSPNSVDVSDWLRTVGGARSWIGRTLVFDSPEYGPLGQADNSQIKRWLDGLYLALEGTERCAILNMNCVEPPSWALERGAGPLFVATVSTQRASEEFLLAFLDEFSALKEANRHLRIDWHLSAHDFEEPRSHVVARAVQLALSCPNMVFTFDRPRRPIALAEGIDRQNPAVLLDVRLPLLKFFEQPQVGGDIERFLVKLPSLLRMATNAAMQKRRHLRLALSEGSPLAREFLLDRARLVIAPVTLDLLVQRLTGQSFSISKLSLGMGQRIVARLLDNVSASDGVLTLESTEPVDSVEASSTESGRNLIASVGSFPSQAQAGTLTMAVSAEMNVDDLISLLQFALKKTELARLKFQHTHKSIEPSSLLE